jgi:hypothetical protein
LVVGTVPIRVIVGGPVASVELVLDGKPAGSLTPPAWSDDLDLGKEIVPHELVARALDAQRNELARARQWLNLPRPPAEVEILLERNALGLVTSARFSWESLTGEQPKSVRASFNGKPVTASKEHSVRLPAYNTDEVQLLTVELEFENAVHARKDLVFGGRAGEQAESELTAVPIHVRAGRENPTPAMLQGVLRSGGKPLDVVAVEEGAGILLVVRDTVARGLGRFRFEGSLQMLRRDLLLDRHCKIRFVWPRPAAYPGSRLPVELFPVSSELDSGTGGLRWILTRVFNPQPEHRSPRFTDAVAVAGLNAYGTFRRRAVLLVLSPEDHDTSQYDADMVRRFLASLRVPLFVWSLGPPVGPVGSAWAWTEAIDVSSEEALKAEFARIKVELETQRIVWVPGKVLPQDVSLLEDTGLIEPVH